MLSTSTSTKTTTKSPGYGGGALVLLLSLAVILTALAFQYIGGYEPCALCYHQRYAYYAGIPLTFAALVLMGADLPRIAGLLLFAVSLMFLVNAGLGAYHSGVEWKFWPGPQTCSGTAAALPTDAGNLLSAISKAKIVPCDEAAWRFAGISMAGYNAIFSLLLFALAIKASFAAATR